MTVTARFDSSVSQKVIDIINDDIRVLNATPGFTRNVSLFVTSDLATVPPEKRAEASKPGVANFTYTTNNIGNNNIYVNPTYDYSSPRATTTQAQSLLHELSHVYFPGVAKGTVAHDAPF